MAAYVSWTAYVSKVHTLVLNPWYTFDTNNYIQNKKKLKIKNEKITNKTSKKKIKK